MLDIIIPSDFIADLSAQATEIVADLFPIWVFISGIIVGLFILAFMIDMFLGMFGKRFARAEQERSRTETIMLNAEVDDMEADMDLD